MSVGPLGFVGSAAGTVGAQAKGVDVERSQELAAGHQRQVEAEAMAEDAAGIGRTDGDNHSATDRDADGRLPFQFGPPSKRDEPAADADAKSQAIDPTGISGSQLDLSG